MAEHKELETKKDSALEDAKKVLLKADVFIPTLAAVSYLIFNAILAIVCHDQLYGEPTILFLIAAYRGYVRQEEAKEEKEKINVLERRGF